MSILGDALGGPLGQVKLILAGAVIVAALGGIWYVKNLQGDVKKLEDQVTSLTASNKILQENNDVMKSNQDKLSSANETNLSTIKDLEAEREASLKAIEDLSNTAKSNKALIAKLSGGIVKMKQDPKNDGPVAPVLRETVREVQNNRR